MADPTYIDTATGELADGDAWVEIQTQTLLDSESDVAAITFSTGTGTQNFSQYLDMVLLGAIGGAGTGTTASNSWYARLNNDSTSGIYHGLNIYDVTSGSTLSHENWTNSYMTPGDLPGNTGTNRIMGFFMMELHDTNAGKYTTGLFSMGSEIKSIGNNYIRTSTFQYRKWDAINEIKIYGSMNTRSCKLTLYGLLPKMDLD